MIGTRHRQAHAGSGQSHELQRLDGPVADCFSTLNRLKLCLMREAVSHFRRFGS